MKRINVLLLSAVLVVSGSALAVNDAQKAQHERDVARNTQIVKAAHGLNKQSTTTKTNPVQDPKQPGIFSRMWQGTKDIVVSAKDTALEHYWITGGLVSAATLAAHRLGLLPNTDTFKNMWAGMTLENAKSLFGLATYAKLAYNFFSPAKTPTVDTPKVVDTPIADVASQASAAAAPAAPSAPAAPVATPQNGGGSLANKITGLFSRSTSLDGITNNQK